MKTYFDAPTLVKFIDPDGGHYVGGIGYRDRIICGCCGGTFEIEEIYYRAPAGLQPVVEQEEWDTDLSEEILYYFHHE